MAGFSRKGLATALGVSYWSVCKYLDGSRIPPPDVVAQIAEVTGVSTDYLLGRTDNPIPPSAVQENDQDIAFWLRSTGDLSAADRKQLLDFADWLRSRPPKGVTRKKRD
jgi:transcriptional regulator with XRE-family HTH domain